MERITVSFRKGDKTKIVGVNYTLGDIDLLSNTSIGKIKIDDFIAFVNDDNIVIHTRGMLTEGKLCEENQPLFVHVNLS